MGAVGVRGEIYDAVVRNAAGPGIEFFHGYTYSGHPLAAAAGLATLDVYESEGLFQRATAMAPCWEEAVHSLKDLPHVLDIRNLGMVAAVELAPAPTRRVRVRWRSSTGPLTMVCLSASPATSSPCRRP